MAKRKLEVVIDGVNKGLRSALTGAASDIDRFEAKTSRVGEALKRLGKYAGVAFVSGLATAGAATVKFGADFEKAMTSSLAIMGGVSDEMRTQMETAAREVAKTTTFSAEQAAESYYFLASAGMTAEQSIAALPGVAAFAQAGMFDMAQATDLLTDAQSALGLTVDDASKNLENQTRISDVLVKANTLANASVEQFASALTNKAGTAAKILGKDVEETTAVLAAFADQGVKGEEAGEKLNIVWRDLQKASIENAAAFEAHGIAVYDASGEMRHTADIIGDLEAAFAGMSDEEKKTTLATLGFQERSQAAMLTLFGTSDAIREYDSALHDAGGTTEEVAEKQLQNFWSQLGLVKDQLIDVGLTVWETMGPSLTETVKGLVGSIGPAFESLGRLFSEVFEKLGPELSDLVGRIGAGFGRLVDAIIDSGLMDILAEIAELFVDTFIDVLEASLPAVISLIEGFGGALKVIQPVLQLVGDMLSTFAELIGELPGGLTLVIAGLALFGSNILALVTGPVSLLNNVTIGLLSTFGTLAAHPILVAGAIGGGAFYGLYKWAESLLDKTDPIKQQLDGIRKKWDEMTQSTREATIQSLEYQAANSDNEDEIKRLKQEIDRLNGALNINVGASQDLVGKLRLFSVAMDDNKTAAMEMLPELEKLGSGMAEMGREFSGDVLQMLRNMGPKAQEAATWVVKGFMSNFGATWQANYDDIDALSAELAGLLTAENYYTEAGQTSVRAFIDNLVATGQLEQDAADELARMLAAQMGQHGIEGGETMGELFASHSLESLKAKGGDLTGLAYSLSSKMGEEGGPGGTEFGQNWASNAQNNLNTWDWSGLGKTVANAMHNALQAWWDNNPVIIPTRYSEPDIAGTGYHTGGLVMHEGGWVKAHAGILAHDEVHAILKRKEFVMQESAVDKYGVGFMQAVNAGKLGASQTINIYGDFILDNVREPRDFLPELSQLLGQEIMTYKQVHGL